MAGKYGLSQGPVKGKEAEWTGIDWCGNTVRSINDRPFYPHLQNINVLNPDPIGASMITIPNPDFRAGNPRTWGNDSNHQTMSDSEFKESLKSHPQGAELLSSMENAQSNKTSDTRAYAGTKGSTKTTVVATTANVSKAKEKSNRLIEYYGTDDWAALELQAHRELGTNNPSVFIKAKQKAINFAKLVKENFQKIPAGHDPFVDATVHVGPASGTPPYIALETYSNTEHGAFMIERVLADNVGKSEADRFKIQEGGSSAAGNENFIMFPSDFGTAGTGGYINRFAGREMIDYIAVVHHEFRHTRYFGKLATHESTIQEERDAVRLHSNPARILNGNEPRYTYYQWDKSGGDTINIMTGHVDPGKMTVDKNKPQTPRTLTHASAYNP